MNCSGVAVVSCLKCTVGTDARGGTRTRTPVKAGLFESPESAIPPPGQRRRNSRRLRGGGCGLALALDVPRLPEPLHGDDDQGELERDEQRAEQADHVARQARIDEPGLVAREPV